MTTTIPRFPAELEDALYSLVIAAKCPNAAALDKLVRQYPEHAQDLTEIAVALALEALEDEGEVTAVEVDVQSTSPAVSRAMSQFNNRLHDIHTLKSGLEKKGAITSENPFLSLSREQMRSLATHLHANTLFIMKLRDRVVDHRTLSDGFKRTVAEGMKAPLELIVGHFSGRQELAMGAHYKADKKPTVSAQQTFEEAIRTSNLTPKQQAHLLSL